ncbi:MAG TPA: hypothetical protein PKM59_07515, partial [Thermodesulfobacteriota bacterium]|nr:hypothetical protein [Thermodesulfobacteriota bacterium]
MVERMIKGVWRRRLFFLAGDAGLILFSFVACFFVRFEFSFPKGFPAQAATWLPMLIVLKVLLLWAFGLYRVAWSYVGLKEMAGILKAGAIWTVAAFALVQADQWLGWVPSLPRSVVLLDGVFSVLLISAFRIARRVWREVLREKRAGARTLIVGAG